MQVQFLPDLLNATDESRSLVDNCLQYPRGMIGAVSREGTTANALFSVSENYSCGFRLAAKFLDQPPLFALKRFKQLLKSRNKVSPKDPFDESDDGNAAGHRLLLVNEPYQHRRATKSPLPIITILLQLIGFLGITGLALHNDAEGLMTDQDVDSSAVVGAVLVGDF
jgi:hypothetical protein